MAKQLNLPVKIDYASKRDFYFKIRFKTKKKTNFNNDDSNQNNEIISDLFKNDKISNECIKVRLLKQSIQFTTKNLLNLNERINETKEDVFQITNE